MKAAAKKIVSPPKSTVEIFSEADYPQGSDAWKKLRAGVPTASNFAAMMAKGEGGMRTNLLNRLAGEIITGEPEETFKNGAMERGNAMEDEARRDYAFTRGIVCERVGFIRNGKCGCSAELSDRRAQDVGDQDRDPERPDPYHQGKEIPPGAYGAMPREPDGRGARRDRSLHLLA